MNIILIIINFNLIILNYYKYDYKLMIKIDNHPIYRLIMQYYLKFV